jgi:hypothetical protein
MMINLEAHRDDLRRAHARSQKLATRAQLLVSDGHLFRVASATTAGRWYLVEIFYNSDGEIIASCDCLAGQALTVCHHIAAAAQNFIDTENETESMAEEAVN